jgi:hypothetical protein
MGNWEDLDFMYLCREYPNSEKIQGRNDIFSVLGRWWIWRWEMGDGEEGGLMIGDFFIFEI